MYLRKESLMKTREIRRMPLCAVLVIVGISSAHPPGSEKIPLALGVAQDGRRGWEGILKREGYPFDTVAQLQEAAKNGKLASVRWSALYLLAARAGRDALPVFKEALTDQDPETRTTAARLLGAFGDRGGIEGLRRDLALAPRQGEPDPNLVKLQGDQLRRAKSKDFTLLRHAIDAANALSELGDASGLELAARVALESPVGLFRMGAITTLANLAVHAASDKSVLAGKAIDPEAVLVAVAQSETNPRVLARLRNDTAKLPRERSRKIYEKLIASPHPTEKDREMMKSILKLYDREAKKQSKDQSAEPKKQ